LHLIGKLFINIYFSIDKIKTTFDEILNIAEEDNLFIHTGVIKG